MELLEDSIKCKFCNQILVKPVLLPCGNTICKFHEEERHANTIYCIVCENNHEIPETNGLPRNLALESLIEKKIENLDLGAEQIAAKDMYNNFSNLFEKFDKLKNNPETLIHEWMVNLRNQVDLRCEELKSQIDKDAMKLIAQIDEYEAECKANLPSIKSDIELAEKIDGLKNDMIRWKQQLNTFSKDVQLWKNIYRDISNQYCRIRIDYSNFKFRILLDRCYDYSDLYLSVGNDYDLIKNHSISIVVENVSQYKDGYFRIKKASVRLLGIDWSIYVCFGKEYDDQMQYVYIYLDLDPLKNTRRVKVFSDYSIINRIDPNKSVRKRIDRDKVIAYYNNDYDVAKFAIFDNNPDNNGDFEMHKIIKYDDLIDNPELYDAESDSFIAQVDIKNISFG